MTTDPSMTDIDHDKATVLWIAMMGHVTKVSKFTAGHCLFIMDNFYTHHAIRRALQKFTDNKVKILGTVCMNFVDAVNKPNVNKEQGNYDAQRPA